MNAPGPLISVEALAHRLGDPAWAIVDCRHNLAQPEAGRMAWAEGHIPGAVFLHLDDDLSGERTGSNGRHPLPDPAMLAQRLGACGIDQNTHVVAYDDAGGMMAARLWWLLGWLGHPHAHVLDGGLRAWREAGHPLEQAIPRPEPRRFMPALQTDRAVDAATVSALLDSDTMQLIDARSPDRFRGENETLDAVGGHIPGAQNRFFRANLDERGHFKPAENLRDEFAALLDGRDPAAVVHQCGSGVTACHNLLAMELAGLGGSRLYPGSWSEWCADPARPVAKGET